MFKQWFDKQRQVDDYILKQYNERYGTNYGHQEFLTERILALSVELAEFANETRCFKYWSTDQEGRFEHMCREYADLLAFMPSMALSAGIDAETAELYYLEKCDINISRQDNNY